jgi:hypothetical protein
LVQIETYGMKINIKIKSILQEISYILKKSVPRSSVYEKKNETNFIAIKEKNAFVVVILGTI